MVIEKLVGFSNFKRHNPKTDKFDVEKFDHIEVWCNDATNVARRFSVALGLKMVAQSDISTGNHLYTSYVLKSNDITFVFTAPYWTQCPEPPTALDKTFKNFDRDHAHELIKKHGYFVRAIGIVVANATEAFNKSVQSGGKAVLQPATITDSENKGEATIAEVVHQDDVVLRFVTRNNFGGVFLPGYRTAESRPDINFGLERIDHIVTNVPKLLDAVNYVMGFSGFHEFAEFVSDDVGTSESGLNSMVLSSNNEMILMPFNEPTFGTKRKSQIQSYLEHNQGAGVQHIAILTKDIFATLKKMYESAPYGGVEFMPKPNPAYYAALPERIGNILSPEQYKEIDELGILVDKDEEGVLLQIFTKPLFDRPTLFVEIIQRVGCTMPSGIQRGGCGGFGKGNFGALFKSIEDYEKMLEGVKDGDGASGSAQISVM